MGAMARVCVCVGVGGAMVLSLVLSSSPASAQSALLDTLSSRVTIGHPTGATNEVATEEIIRSGDTIATDDTGRAVVTYPDGSTALLEENSSLTIEFVQTTTGDYVVRMQQTLGRVWYAVTRTVAFGSRYEVHSTGMASVIRAGSDSYVSVSPSGEATVTTIAGVVDTTTDALDGSSPASTSTLSMSGALPGPSTPAPSTPKPSAAPVVATTVPSRTAAPAATPVVVPPVATLPPVATSVPVKTKTPTATLPVATPKPTAAPTPAPTPKDKFGPRKDEPGQPPPKLTLPR